MQVFDIQTDRDSLATFGTEAIAGLCAGDFFGLANRFGYMRAFDRNHAVALKSDLTSSIAKIEGATRLLGAAHASVVVKYFKPNDIPLFVLIECRVQTDAG